jgi:prevent-host-death family protein
MVIDHDIFGNMSIPPPQTISISEFKARCLAVLKRVQQTGQPIVVTRRGDPVAEIVPARGSGINRDWLGAFRDSGTIVGDIISPISTEGEWEVLADQEPK